MREIRERDGFETRQKHGLRSGESIVHRRIHRLFDKALRRFGLGTDGKDRRLAHHRVKLPERDLFGMVQPPEGPRSEATSPASCKRPIVRRTTTALVSMHCEGLRRSSVRHALTYTAGREEQRRGGYHI